MDFLKEIITEGLKAKKEELTFLCADVSVEKTVQIKLYEILLKINKVLNNDKLNGVDLSEEIVRVFDCAGK